MLKRMRSRVGFEMFELAVNPSSVLVLLPSSLPAARETNSLQRAQRLTKPRHIGRDKLVGPLDSGIEVDDLVKGVFGREVEVVDVAGQTRAEGDGELLLEVADLFVSTWGGRGG